MASSSAREQRENIDALSDPFARSTLRVAYHVRKYALLYVCGALGAIALSLFPTYTGGGGGSEQAASVATGGQGVYGGNGTTTAPGGAVGTGPASSVPGGSGGVAPGPGGAGSSAAPGSTSSGGTATQSSGSTTQSTQNGQQAAGGSNQILIGQGTTRGGFACSKGVHQLPYSAYAAPCIGKFTGNNGGATFNGVTANSITIALRKTSDATGANAQATNAQIVASGGQPYNTQEGYIRKLTAYFNRTFELYGRQVKLVDVNGKGNHTDEQLDQGQQAACADADTIATSAHAFAALDYEGLLETGVFASCAARYHLMVPQSAGYYPESFYSNIAPYAYATTMNCELIAHEVAEFIGKQVAPYKAQYAGFDGATNLNGLQRTFGTYVPDDPNYQRCVGINKHDMETKYGVSPSRGDQYNYKLDISQFPNDAQRAVVQFAANKDTTIILACDPISPIFLTQDAAHQNYHPEWLIIGVALEDTDNWAQLWDQSEVNGHLYGLSQAAATQDLLNPNNEAGKALKAAGVPFNISSVTLYSLLLSVFNQLQSAGPDLTPANIAAGTRALPASTSGTPFGRWYFGTTHTAIIDSREVYYDGSKTSPANHKTGTYVAIFNGKRFTLGEFPSGQPPFYPGS